MKALCDRYEKPYTNNKVFLMKKLFHLKMREGTFVAIHLNEFSTIVNQLSSIEISFDDEIWALILLASSPNNWEPMRVTISNFVGSTKLSFNDIRDQILAKEVKRQDAGETSTLDSFLNLQTRGRSHDRKFN